MGGPFGSQPVPSARVYVGVVHAVRSRPGHPDHADLLRRQFQQVRERVAQRIGLLSAEPHHRAALAHVGERAGRTHRGVRLERVFVARLDHAIGHLQRGIDVALRLVLLRGLGLLAAKRVVERVVCGPEHRRGMRPFDAQLAGRFDRLLLALAHDRDEVAAAHHAHEPRKLRALVEREHVRARLRRSHHARVEHAGHGEIRDVSIGALDLRRDVEARDRLAGHRVLARILERRRLGDLDVEGLAADELAVGDALRLVGGDIDDAIAHAQRRCRNAEARGGERKQRGAPFRRGALQRRAAVHDAVGAAGAALVHGGGGIAHDERHALDGHVELLRDHLRERGRDAHARFDLADRRGDAAVRGHAQPRIEGRRIDRRWPHGAGGRKRRRGARARIHRASRHRERHHERAAGLEEIAPRGAALRRDEFFGALHVRLPAAMRLAASFTARRMLMWVPQRHFSPESPRRISSSVARGWASSSAAAVMIQPFRQ